MKKFTTIKTLLVGLCTMGAMSAWAQTTTTYDFEDGEKLFTEDSRITASVVEGTQTIYNTEFELDGKAVSFKGAGNAQNGYCFAHFDFSSLCDQAAKVKVEFEAVLGNGARSRISIGDALVRGNTGNSSKTTYNNKGAIFMIGTEKTEGYINGTHNGGLLTALTQKWLKVTVEVDEVANTYTYSIVDKATGDVLYDNGDEPIAFWSSDADECTQIDMFGYINNSQMGLIDNLSITVTKDERQYADYTVKFVDENGTEIKEAATRKGAVGDGITLLPADMEAFKNEDGSMKYFYVSDDTESVTIAEDGLAVVTVTYREANVWNYTVKFENEGGSILGSKTGSGFEGDQTSVPYPKYLEEDGVLYIKDRGISTANEFNFKFNLTEANITKSIEYAASETVTNVVFLSEGEDIDGLTPCNSSNTGVRSSNSSSAYAENDTKITSLMPGKYKIHAIIYDASKEPNSHWIFKAGEKQIADFNCTTVNIQEFDSQEFEVYYETDIIMAKMGGNTMGLDAIYIQKTGDVEIPENVTVEVTDAGWATLYTDFALNFEGTGLTAYTATLSESTVTLTEVTSISAGTGVVLKGAADTYEIPVIDGSDTAKGDLKGDATAATTANGSQYILVMNGSNAQFTKATSGSIAAGKAYLENAGSESRILNIVFAGEATGIKAIETVQADGNVYNMAGQRVAAPQKGLFIMNGKKVIIK